MSIIPASFYNPIALAYIKKIFVCADKYRPSKYISGMVFHYFFIYL